MGSIRRLPPAVRNQIAAGEVVERPAAVVRELVENALDAGASTVSVRIRGAGKRSIRVRDDGIGMSPEDARLALERHATSKIESLADLVSVGSLGFRGEAVPSIASVSRFRLRTRTADAEAGWEISVDGGEALEERPAGMPPGTVVEVRDLFFNVPARRKFLRTDRTEASHVTGVVFGLALAWPSVRFRLQHDGRSVLGVDPADGLEARLAQLEPRWSADAIPVEARVGPLFVRAFLSPPMARRGAAAGLRLFVNGRPIRDRRLFSAVAEAYRRLSSLRGTPKGYLFLEAPPESVDVNVHPAKAEVRFSRPGAIWDAVFRSVRAALDGSPRRVDLAPSQRRGGLAPGIPSEAADRPSVRGARPGFEAVPARVASSSAVGFDTPAAAARFFDFGATPPEVVGQFHRTYIIAEEPRELLLVDQHGAEERVLFNALMERSTSPRTAPLLQPVPLELNPAERTTLAAVREPLVEAGFELEEFGHGSWLLRAVPEALGVGRGLDVLTLALAGDGSECADNAAHDARARIMARLACHGAVTGGVRLSHDRMRAILAALWKTANPSTCPHGRPTVFRLDLPYIERRFGRR